MTTAATATPATPVAPVAPEPGSEAYNQAMIAKADGAATPATDTPAIGSQPAKPVRPDTVPEKFWDAEKGVVRTEDLLKSYTELERAKSAPKPGEPQKIETPKEPDAAAEAVAAGVPKVDFEAYSTEYATSGKLSDESYTKLAAVGLDRNAVDTYIAGKQAQMDTYNGVAHTVAGSPEKYTEMLTWAAEGLSAPEQAEYNKVVTSGNTEALKLAVAGLKARFIAANGERPTLVTGAAVASDGGFESHAQMKEAMRDKRYKSDPAYRKVVENRIANSNIF